MVASFRVWTSSAIAAFVEQKAEGPQRYRARVAMPSAAYLSGLQGPDRTERLR